MVASCLGVVEGAANYPLTTPSHYYHLKRCGLLESRFLGLSLELVHVARDVHANLLHLPDDRRRGPSDDLLRVLLLLLLARVLLLLRAAAGHGLEVSVAGAQRFERIGIGEDRLVARELRLGSGAFDATRFHDGDDDLFTTQLFGLRNLRRLDEVALSLRLARLEQAELGDETDVRLHFDVGLGRCLGCGFLVLAAGWFVFHVWFVSLLVFNRAGLPDERKW